MTISKRQIFGLLKSLPMIRFALMLGGGMVATGFVGLIIVFPWLGHATWHAYRAVRCN